MADTTHTATQPGFPSFLHDEAGADAYAAALTLPKYETFHVRAICGANGALLSFDGTNDHVQVAASGETQVYDLLLPADGSLYVKNLVSGSNFADLKVWIW